MGWSVDICSFGIAPELGEHNIPILTRLGYTEAQMQELKEKNVI